MTPNETICAIATPPGIGAIALVRVSGPDTFRVISTIFRGKDPQTVASHTVHFGTIQDGKNIIDEVLVSVFKTPNSYTREDTAEISCHGSPFIVQKTIALLLSAGCRLAEPGEFTQRAFLNGQLDLAQAEAVADVIAADSEAAHRAAVHQLRGGFSKDLANLREALIHFASLIELELDFAEEDVTFADRTQLETLVGRIRSVLTPLIASFSLGNALKEGIPVAIVGPPNAGKSSLLNVLLNEEKAIVTPIAGTTRDVIEDTIRIGGLKFRLLDTAGIRATTDTVEAIGIERSLAALQRAEIVLKLNSADTHDTHFEELFLSQNTDNQTIIAISTKIDIFPPTENTLGISVENGTGIEALKTQLANYGQQHQQAATVVTNLRHYQHLVATDEALVRVLNGLAAGTSHDWLALDIRAALRALGEITGEITTDDLLANIFSKFCIGK